MEPNNFRILVVDDERPLTVLLSRILTRSGYQVKSASNGIKALSTINDFYPNLVITDLKMPDISGIELLKKVRSEKPEIDFILLTAYATVENAVEAMKEGALDYLIKPLKDPDELRIAVSKVVERQTLMAVDTLWRKQLAEGLPPTDVLFAGMEEVWKEIQHVAKTDATVLLQGESGTGKSLVAKAIHHLSERKGLFIELNCAAIPETLIESELFGHEKGAFTGAIKAKRGKFELAQNGTIFLDEIGEMPLSAQAKFLRVLQERTFERVGGTTTLNTSARIIAATNQDLMAGIREKRFREDLYYRLNVFPITLPPLRKRLEAIQELTNYLVRSISMRVGKKVSEISDDTLKQIKSYDWPGNMRELHNVIERAIILSRDSRLTLPPLTTSLIEVMPVSATKPLRSIRDLEKEAIETTIRETDGHRRKAAKILGISIRTLQYKLKEYGLLK
ncbi:MAG: sigma-54-dependent Fis family transcriptional regulator [Deltaproteobacteria bacterium]|nr:sigma-54-dependent Fis family transcriptional regulator [Deltaproteobacteria bacterium]MBW1719517.1 sigma-54-dependent Fis family transcriptional regulator [Deltaproteobacteria bacterium]MBW1932674.1 sigma-54-dependent Fis family transcriptional regulator [Deltaproteobacteria bacterium]MBW1938594.1 sigma-54-dependent Fis family transcriptional regulator [Deltaproteobacteria bacterium]MBW1964335.1 sigma-54-dependent Fis family transcriptional regulator [Deltaproteobacteria bacterium]